MKITFRNLMFRYVFKPLGTSQNLKTIGKKILKVIKCFATFQNQTFINKLGRKGEKCFEMDQNLLPLNIYFLQRFLNV